MDANAFPTFEERTACLADAMEFLNQIIQANLEPEIIERATILYARVRACAAPYETDIYEEMVVRREVMGMQDEVHKLANYHAFIHHLEEADTRNLLACYLPDRSWAQDWTQKPYFADGCELCRNWPTTSSQATDCQFLVTPLDAVFDSYIEERWGFCMWIRKLVVGIADFPQPQTLIDDYVIRVAEYSRMHSPIDDIWTYDRILNTMMETYDRVEGFQTNCRQFLRMGWQNTLRKIEVDTGTAAARVRAFLTPAQTLELEEAIHYDARMYYVASYDLTEDWRCVNQQPRRWVIDHLRTNPPTSGPQYFLWGKILTIDRLWSQFETDAQLNVWVWCQSSGTDRARWEKRFVGRLDGRDPELHALVILNKRERQALQETAEWRMQLDWERERGNEVYEMYHHDDDSDDSFDHEFGCDPDAGLYEADDEAELSEDENLYERAYEGDTVAEDKANEGRDDNDVEDGYDDSLGGLKPKLVLAEMHSHFLDRERMSPRESEDGCSRVDSEEEHWETPDCADSSTNEEYETAADSIDGSLV
ncbi:hypothetical protein ColTof4_02114 [Colletotrichum tofieldiae]|uniref:Uncharacterized protein n=1 Tax=Colletotrichum tofieldiae TaxID=708197 RepID=A0A166QG08_9PEZI|nr:hypothetical protein CT0861_07495 [Colletotrichum tofieldiae]GKT62261.1 hypothetical protein ColTof3_09600 [Colletotrichum tofieldiae]GKT69691.1 hypothetical protein ColTof4_02114 [Colletotrichum tofieldiae]